MGMKRIVWIIVFALFAAAPIALSADGYRWVDEGGVTHLTNNIEDVPEKLRDKVEKTGEAVNYADDSRTGDTSKEKKKGAGYPDPVLKGKKTKGGGTEIPYKKRNKTMLIDVAINGKVMQFLVDTGATNTVITKALQKEMDFEKIPNSIITLQTGGGPVESYMVWIDELLLGTEKLLDVRAVVQDFGSGSSPKGIIGMNVLELYAFSINPKKSILTLEPL